MSALIHRIDSDRSNMGFDDAWSQVSVAVPLMRAGSGAAAEVADYSGMIARAPVLTTSTRHISNLVAVPSSFVSSRLAFGFAGLLILVESRTPTAEVSMTERSLCASSHMRS